MVVFNKINENAYYDSVTLMVISSKISVVEGVNQAAVMMGTDHNKEIMKNSNILNEEGEKATASDMIIGLEATDESVIQEVLSVVDKELQSKTTDDEDVKTKFKTIDAAAKRISDLNLAVISVPGKYAKNEAMKALNNNLNVLLFSDNVSVEEEVELKEKAIEKGLLMMGPDCGTAILNGVALGFANKVSKGKIGIVGASGTGIQEVTTLIDKNDSGITQALGTGGRDLKAAGPSFHDRSLTVGIRANTLEILDEHNTPVVTFQRVFGQQPGTIFEPAALLPLLVAKPGSWSHSPVRKHVTDPLRDWLDTAPTPDRRRLLVGLHQAADATDFDTATKAATRLITIGDDPSTPALGMLARRMAQGSEPSLEVVNLGVYDQLTRREATA